MKPARVYVDTSVIGGCLDEEFAGESGALFQQAREGSMIQLVSDLTLAELELAPQPVREILTTVPRRFVEGIEVSEESRRLQSEYLKGKVLEASQANDAHHVALATIARADLLVSWNFKHLVRWAKIRLFNSVNLREGYPVIEIRSPREVV
jgi:predicted nucleic acid-binding protein